jgi:hypothetical protein
MMTFAASGSSKRACLAGLSSTVAISARSDGFKPLFTSFEINLFQAKQTRLAVRRVQVDSAQQEEKWVSLMARKTTALDVYAPHTNDTASSGARGPFTCARNAPALQYRCDSPHCCDGPPRE